MSDLITTMPSSTDLNSTSSNNQEEKKDTILKLFQFDLERHRMREVLDMFKRVIVPEVRKNGSYIVWDLVPIICQRLRGLSEFRFKTFSLCRQILLDLCEICNPKELLIIYLSELENDLNITRYAKSNNTATTNDENNEDVEDLEITDSNCFKGLLKPFEVILLKLPKKRNETLKSVLSSLNEHISRLSLSSIAKIDFENGDRAKLMMEPVVKSLNSVLSMYVDFLETFVKEVDLYNPNNQGQTQSKTSDPNIQRVILLKTLLLILDYPIKYIDLFQGNAKDIPNDGKLSSPNISTLFDEDFITTRMIAVKIVRLISSLHSNFYTLLNRTDLISSDEYIETNCIEFSDVYLSSNNFQSAISIICYLLATEPELFPSNFMPRVYTHIYNFGIHLPYIRHLLEDNQFLVFDKGMELLLSLLDHIKEESLEVHFLDLLRQHPIEKSLVSIMVFAGNKSCRKMAMSLFKKLVYSFEPLGRYKILYTFLSQPRQHAGLQGLAVTMYKDLLFTHTVYQGTNLHRLVRSIIGVSLPHESNSDLLDKNDLIFAALNFLRYIFMRDRKTENKTRIWDIIVVINENFIKPLQEGIDMSRTFFKLELCRLKEMKMKMNKMIDKGKGKKRSERNKIEINVIEKNEKVPFSKMTIDQEHKQISMAMQNFDLIESLLVRLREIIDEQ